jgi:hypothetical protein
MTYYDSVMMEGEKANACSFAEKVNFPCGNSRGCSETVRLVDCCDDVSAHLKKYHLLKSKITECELILARSGYFDIIDTQKQCMWICPRHRHSLGKFWRSATPCQHPLHKHNAYVKKTCKGRDIINLDRSKEIFLLYGVIVPLGSRK